MYRHTLLDPALAQAIVDRTMAILDHNINVMDERGIIIASGQLERIGQQHDGAALCIAQQRVIEADTGSEKHLQGVKPGINLPLWQDGRIVGVVGITGQPDQVRQFGELVRMTAEMMLEQNRLQRELQNDSRLVEALVLQLISPEQDEQASTQMAQRLGLDPVQTRVALVIEASHHAAADYALWQMLAEQLGKHGLCARPHWHEFVLLLPADEANWQAGRVLSQLEKLLPQWQQLCGQPLHAALGHRFNEKHGAALSYLTARATLQQGMTPRPLLQHFDSHQLPVLLSTLADGWQAGLLQRPLQQLQQHDPHGNLRQTLACWFRHDLHHGDTARALAIHRNTLDYRLQRIADACTLDLDRFEHRVQLYLALQLSNEL